MRASANRIPLLASPQRGVWLSSEGAGPIFTFALVSAAKDQSFLERFEDVRAGDLPFRRVAAVIAPGLAPACHSLLS